MGWSHVFGGFVLGVIFGAAVMALAFAKALDARDQELTYYRAKAQGRART